MRLSGIGCGCQPEESKEQSLLSPFPCHLFSLELTVHCGLSTGLHKTDAHRGASAGSVLGELISEKCCASLHLAVCSMGLWRWVGFIEPLGWTSSLHGSRAASGTDSCPFRAIPATAFRNMGNSTNLWYHIPRCFALTCNILHFEIFAHLEIFFSLKAKANKSTSVPTP